MRFRNGIERALGMDSESFHEKLMRLTEKKLAELQAMEDGFEEENPELENIDLPEDEDEENISLTIDRENMLRLAKTKLIEGRVTIDSNEVGEYQLYDVEIEGSEHKFIADDDIEFWGYDGPGTYHCACLAKVFDGTVLIGKVEYVIHDSLWEIFSEISGMEEKIEAITEYLSLSENQREFLMKASRRKKWEKSEETGRRNLINTPKSLKLLYRVMRHSLPEDIRFKCEELIREMAPMGISNESNILMNILYCCGEDAEARKPFLSKEECMEVFRRRRYGDDPWIEDVIKQLSLIERCDSTGTVIVLVGPPGSGKTEIAKAIAECTNKPFCTVRCGNKNAYDICGTKKLYADACSGEVQETLLHYGTNSVILLDEFDKMVKTEKEGDPYAPFASAFDDNRIFCDSFVLTPVSTKNVIWVITANDIEMVPDYIRNRYSQNTFVISPYSAEKKAEIAKKFIVPKYMHTYNFSDDKIVFTDDGLYEIARTASDSGARITSQKIYKLFAEANDLLVSGASAPIVINKDFVVENAKNSAKVYHGKNPIGIC